MPEHSAEVQAEAKRLVDGGLSASEAARKLGLAESTVRTWRDRVWNTPTAMPQDALKDMELAALREKVKQLEQPRPAVVSLYQPSVEASDPSSRWKRAEIENDEHIQKALYQAKFETSLPHEVIAVTFVSDQHIAIGNCIDLRRMREDAEIIASTEGLYAVLGGDGTDNHIKHRSAVLASRSQPKDQYDLFEWYLSIFAHRILVAISGNHDLWTDQMAGVDVMGGLLKRQGVCYAPDEAILDLRVGEQPYKLGVRHQYRLNSSFNECHAPKQWYRNGDCDWDIGCVCHHHVSSVEPFFAHGVERWACRPGSYQITSAYSRQYGYSSTRPMCPTFILWPDKRQIVGFHDVRLAIKTLQAERS